MASLAHPARPADPSSAPAARTDDLAWFKLAKPVTLIIDGEPRNVDMLGMRAFDTCDLALCDEHQGKPVVMMQAIVAALCGIELEEVRKIDLKSFCVMAEDVEWQVRWSLLKMCLNPCDYLVPGAAGDNA